MCLAILPPIVTIMTDFAHSHDDYTESYNMAFLNKQERDALLDEIKDLNFNQIKGRLFRKDKESRLAYYRNVQETNKWMTRIVLEGLGTRVTLVERLSKEETPDDFNREYELSEIIVEPTEENRL